MAHYIVTATFQNHDNLSKDRFVNRFYFVGGIGAASMDEAKTGVARLAQFYSDFRSGTPLDSFLSSELNRSVLLTAYDWDAPTPRPILAQASHPLGAAGSARPIPTEVAVCLSFYSQRNLPRKRGRVYIGPLDLTALAATGGVVAPGLVTSLVASGNQLMADYDGVIPESLTFTDSIPLAVAAPAVNWVQHSAVGSTGTAPTKAHPEIPKHYVPELELVSGGWVDNEFDGQHRRRMTATMRTLLA